MKTFISTRLNVAVLFVASSILGVGCSTTSPISGNSDPALGQARADSGLQRHFYASTGIGASRLEPDDRFLATLDQDDRVEPAGQVTIGADINRMLAVELHSADLGSAGFSQGGRINYHAHGASALVYAGKNRDNFKRSGLSPYGRLGVGLVEHDNEGSFAGEIRDHANVVVGAGMEYMTRRGLGIRAEGVQFDHDAQYAQVGVVYRTGRRAESRPIEIAEAPAPEPVSEAAQPQQVAYDECSDFAGSLDGVNFEFDSSALTATAQNILDDVAATLAECDNAPVSISAHTDSIGSDGYNQALSQRRADAVLDYLSSAGVNAGRMTPQAMGESQPIDSNATSEGRSRNRRVELVAY